VAYLAKTLSDHMVKEIASHFKRKDKIFEKILTCLGENLVKGRKIKYRISVA